MEKENQLAEKLILPATINEVTNESQSDAGKQKKHHPLTPILYMLIGATSMGVMNIIAKYVAQMTTISVLQLGVYRGIFMCMGYTGHAAYSDIDLTDVPRDKTWWVLLRAIGGVTSAMFCFAGIYLMPLSLAVVLYYTQPISSSLLALIFNNEPLGCLQIISILSAMVGVIMLT